MQDRCGDWNFSELGSKLFLRFLLIIYLFDRWYGGFMSWNSLVRFRHITSGRYLGITNGEVCVIHRDKANADAITFILTPIKVNYKLK